MTISTQAGTSSLPTHISSRLMEERGMNTGSFQELRVCFVEYMRVNIPHTCASSHVVDCKIVWAMMKDVDCQDEFVDTDKLRWWEAVTKSNPGWPAEILCPKELRRSTPSPRESINCERREDGDAEIIGSRCGNVSHHSRL